MIHYSSSDFDDIDAELDRYSDYEAQFNEHARRKNKADHKPKKSQGTLLSSVAAETGGMEGGFKTTYVPGLFEQSWLPYILKPFYEMGLITDVLGRIKDGKEAKGDDYGMLVINTDECIHCGACETECPTQAIYEDSSVPEDMKEFVELNEQETAAMSDSELDAARCTSKE